MLQQNDHREDIPESSKIHIRVVLFDMGGVLADDLFLPFIHGIEEFSKIEFNKALHEKIHEKMKELFNIIKVDKNFTEDMYMQSILTSFPELTNITVEDLKIIIRDTFSPFYGTIAIVERLSKANKHKIGIISNHGNEWFAAMIKKFSLHRLFRDPSIVISSHEPAVAKPDVEIFAYGFNKIKELLPDIKSNEVLFIDDKMDNVKAAKKFGFNSFQWSGHQNTYGEFVKLLVKYGVDEAVEI